MVLNSETNPKESSKLKLFGLFICCNDKQPLTQQYLCFDILRTRTVNSLLMLTFYFD